MIMKPITELTDCEAEQKLTELITLCQHEGPPDYKCFYCRKCGELIVLDRYEPFATSYDAIIPVIQGMDEEQVRKFDDYFGYFSSVSDWFSTLFETTPRQLLNAVIEVLESK